MKDNSLILRRSNESCLAVNDIFQPIRVNVWNMFVTIPLLILNEVNANVFKTFEIKFYDNWCVCIYLLLVVWYTICKGYHKVIFEMLNDVSMICCFLWWNVEVFRDINVLVRSHCPQIFLVVLDNANRNKKIRTRHSMILQAVLYERKFGVLTHPEKLFLYFLCFDPFSWYI